MSLLHQNQWMTFYTRIHTNQNDIHISTKQKQQCEFGSPSAKTLKGPYESVLIVTKVISAATLKESPLTRTQYTVAPLKESPIQAQYTHVP